MYYYGRRRKDKPTTPFSYAFLVIVILSILFMVTLLVVTNMNSKNKAQMIRESRESIHVEEKGGRIVINETLLRSDYAAWYRQKKQADSYMTALMVAISIMVLSCIGCSIGESLYLERHGYSGDLDRRRIGTYIWMVFMLVFIIVTWKFLLFSNETKPDEAVLWVREYTVTDKESVKKRKQERKYYVYTVEGGKLQVDKTDYEKVAGSGTYYFGMQDGKVFNIYLKEEYCKDES